MPKADIWIDYRKLRNTLTNEYPDNEDEMIESIVLVIEVYESLKEIYAKMLDRV
jgi:hypothetical protein